MTTILGCSTITVCKASTLNCILSSDSCFGTSSYVTYSYCCSNHRMQWVSVGTCCAPMVSLACSIPSFLTQCTNTCIMTCFPYKYMLWDRFNKGRKAWGSIVNRTRDISRQALTWMQSPGDLHKVHCFLSYAAAFSYCCRWEEDLQMGLKGYFRRRNWKL
jgi:predicted membrane chloride channel (bestrophin family)